MDENLAPAHHLFSSPFIFNHGNSWLTTTSSTSCTLQTKHHRDHFPQHQTQTVSSSSYFRSTPKPKGNNSSIFPSTRIRHKELEYTFVQRDELQTWVRSPTPCDGFGDQIRPDSSTRCLNPRWNPKHPLYQDRSFQYLTISNPTSQRIFPAKKRKFEPNKIHVRRKRIHKRFQSTHLFDFRDLIFFLMILWKDQFWVLFLQIIKLAAEICLVRGSWKLGHTFAKG